MNIASQNQRPKLWKATDGSCRSKWEIENVAFKIEVKYVSKKIINILKNKGLLGLIKDEI